MDLYWGPLRMKLGNNHKGGEMVWPVNLLPRFDVVANRNMAPWQGRRNKFRSGTTRTGVWGCHPQRGSKGQSSWWGSGGEAPWKPALFQNLNYNLYSKLIWDYYKMGCVILTRKLFNLPICQSWRCISISGFFLFCFFFFIFF